MDVDAPFDRPAERRILVIGNVDERLAGILIDMNGAFLAEIAEVMACGIDAGFIRWDGKIGAGDHAQTVHDIDRLVQADRPCRLRCRDIGERNGRILDHPAGAADNILRDLRRFRHLVPDRSRCSEIICRQPGIDVGAPITGPWHAAEGQEEDEDAGEGTRHRMQVTPEDAPGRIATNREHAAGLLTRPPQIDAGHHEDEGKARDDLDEAIGPFSEIFEAVDALDHPAEFLLRADRSQDAAVIGVDVDDGRLAVLGYGYPGRAVRRRRFVIGGCAGAGKGCERRIGDLLWLQHRAGLGNEVAVRIESVGNLILEQIERAGDRQIEHEGNDEKAGEKMPAPDRTIERDIMGCCDCRLRSGKGRHEILRRSAGCHDRSGERRRWFAI